MSGWKWFHRLSDQEQAEYLIALLERDPPNWFRYFELSSNNDTRSSTNHKRDPNEGEGILHDSEQRDRE